MNNLKKILIAYDGSDCSTLAIEGLQRAGLPAEAEAVVVSVEEVWLPAPPVSSYQIVQPTIVPEGNLAAKKAPEIEKYQTEADKLAAHAREMVQRFFPAWKVMARSLIGSPAKELLTFAQEWGADLIVVGSHGRNALGRFFFGSVSQKIIYEAHCTVRVSRRDDEEESKKERILIGIDGSVGAEAAVDEVAARTFPAETAVRLVMVCDPVEPTLVGSLIPEVRDCADECNQEERAWAKEIIKKQAEKLKSAGLQVSQAIMEGDPRRALIDEAEEWQATTIFVGARGLSKVDRFLLGSVSAAVAQRAGCSVEIVRPAKHTARR